MGKLILLFVIMAAGFTVSAQAKTYVHEESKSAIVYYAQGENVNASYCVNVSADQAPSTIEDVTKAGCKKLSENGVSLADIQALLPEVKQAMLDSAGLISELVGGLGNMGGDEDMKDLGGQMFSGMIESSKQAIDNIKPEDIFRQFKVEANTPTTESVKTKKDIDDRVEQFVSLTTR